MLIDVKGKKGGLLPDYMVILLLVLFLIGLVGFIIYSTITSKLSPIQ